MFHRTIHVSSSSPEPTRSGSRSKDGNSGGENERVKQVEPGVHITLISLPGGFKDLKRVRFSRRRFNETQAGQWWAENHARVYEQYKIRMVSSFSSSPEPTRSGSERVEQVEPGVYVTLISLPGGFKDIKRVRFSRRRFTETQAGQWWAENHARLYEQYKIRMVSSFSSSTEATRNGNKSKDGKDLKRV